MSRLLNPRAIAFGLHERGVNVLPLQPNGKEPVRSFLQWAERPQTIRDIEGLFGPNATCNIGALGGAHSAAVSDAWGYLAYLDADSHDALAMGRAMVHSVAGDTLTTLSARGGHIWFRTPQPVKTVSWTGGELRGWHSYVVAPGSIHPSGVPYRWADEGASIVYCDHLPGIEFQYVERQRVPRLAAAILRADPQVISRYATRSEVDAALILTLVNAGASFERVKALYLASRHDKHLDPTDRDFEKRLMAEYLRARNAGDRPEYAEAVSKAQHVKTWALGAIDELGDYRVRDVNLRVLLAHCDRAEHAGVNEWHLSRRDVEQQARVSPPTAQRANARLVSLGIITRGRESTCKSAQAWRWGERFAQVCPLPHIPPECGEVGKPARTDAVLSHRAFEHKALGRVAARIFCACLEPATEGEIAAMTGYSPRTVDKHLAFMAKLELVAIREGGRWQAIPDTLDDIARMFEADRIERARLSRIEHERRKHRARLTMYSRAGNSSSCSTITADGA